ncbi:CIC11C00000000079 [Sungouiella intermedia]|uniref:Profilin n=1 Tax=Sungouiella intermedia TaxID=45354 RepID=A0A1L0D1W3_9ASCO|nr:CIC11C00000000079 [[Candida] intermedia]SGZ50444.1 CIC11C00000002819 [[Candida] intermedia]
MSWDQYVEALVATHIVDKAAIYSLFGELGAQTGDFQLTDEEFALLASSFEDPSPLQQDGMNIQNIRYELESADTRCVHMRTTGNGIVARKTYQTIMMGHYSHQRNAQRAMELLEEWAGYLMCVGD